MVSCGPGGSGPRSASCTDCHSIPNAVRASLTDQTSSKELLSARFSGPFPIPYPSAPGKVLFRYLPGSTGVRAARVLGAMAAGLEQPTYAIMGTTRSPYRTVVAIVLYYYLATTSVNRWV